MEVINPPLQVKEYKYVSGRSASVFLMSRVHNMEYVITSDESSDPNLLEYVKEMNPKVKVIDSQSPPIEGKYDWITVSVPISAAERDTLLSELKEGGVIYYI